VGASPSSSAAGSENSTPGTHRSRVAIRSSNKRREKCTTRVVLRRTSEIPSRSDRDDRQRADQKIAVVGAEESGRTEQRQRSGEGEAAVPTATARRAQGRQQPVDA